MLVYSNSPMAESRDALLDVWKVYDAHQDRVHQEVLAAALSHPEFGRVAQRAPVAQLAHRISSFRELLGRGVLEGDFGPWLRHVREQGSACARVGEEHAATIDREQSPLFVEAVNAYDIFMLDPRGPVTTRYPGARSLKGYKA